MDYLEQYNKQEIDTLINKDEDASYFLLEIMSGGCCDTCCTWCASAFSCTQNCVIQGTCHCCVNCCTECQLYKSCNG